MAHHKYNLGFMSDEQIYEHVKETTLKYKTFINIEKFNKTLLIP